MSHPPRLWQELHRSMQGRGDVEAAQRGLWRAADDLGYVSTNARNGNYGEQTAIDVERFRLAVELPGLARRDRRRAVATDPPVHRRERDGVVLQPASRDPHPAATPKAAYRSSAA